MTNCIFSQEGGEFMSKATMQGRQWSAALGYNRPQSHFVIGNARPEIRNAAGKVIEPSFLNMTKLELLIEETKLVQATATLRSIERRIASK
jgi:hypothetical protein